MSHVESTPARQLNWADMESDDEEMVFGNPEEIFGKLPTKVIVRSKNTSGKSCEQLEKEREQKAREVEEEAEKNKFRKALAMSKRPAADVGLGSNACFGSNYTNYSTSAPHNTSFGSYSSASPASYASHATHAAPYQQRVTSPSSRFTNAPFFSRVQQPNPRAQSTPAHHASAQNHAYTPTSSMSPGLTLTPTPSHNMPSRTPMASNNKAPTPLSTTSLPTPTSLSLEHGMLVSHSRWEAARQPWKYQMYCKSEAQRQILMVLGEHGLMEVQELSKVLEWKKVFSRTLGSLYAFVKRECKGILNYDPKGRVGRVIGAQAQKLTAAVLASSTSGHCELRVIERFDGESESSATAPYAVSSHVVAEFPVQPVRDDLDCFGDDEEEEDEDKSEDNHSNDDEDTYDAFPTTPNATFSASHINQTTKFNSPSFVPADAEDINDIATSLLTMQW
ncbi:hypothetical protein DIPPA_18490 [Diplonema papillatum]|nr:hypothetical protein DIPPA_18490 [Diplonema papillatum]|eukprot:gene16203-24835_t